MSSSVSTAPSLFFYYLFIAFLLCTPITNRIIATKSITMPPMLHPAITQTLDLFYIYYYSTSIDFTKPILDYDLSYIVMYDLKNVSPSVQYG